MIDGRGACALPDGVRRLVASVLDGFPDHVGRARAPRRLPSMHSSCALPLPSTPLAEADWR